jgi:hypothetical protein
MFASNSFIGVDFVSSPMPGRAIREDYFGLGDVPIGERPTAISPVAGRP